VALLLCMIPSREHSRGNGTAMEHQPDNQSPTGSPISRELTRMTHPVVEALQSRRASDAQLRIADAITAFAGSMPFVYLHAVAFAV
jgi:uncharacterized membrane protein